MELPLHARLYFCRFGSIWRNAKHTNRRSMSSGPLAQFPIASFVRLGRVRLVRKKKTDCPSLTILGRITNHRIMELPLHARLYFCRFGSIWRNAKHTNRRSMPSGRLAQFPIASFVRADASGSYGSGLQFCQRVRGLLGLLSEWVVENFLFTANQFCIHFKSQTINEKLRVKLLPWQTDPFSESNKESLFIWFCLTLARGPWVKTYGMAVRICRIPVRERLTSCFNQTAFSG